MSTRKFAPGDSVTLPTVRIEVVWPPFPGARFAPMLTVTCLLIMPVPPRVVPAGDRYISGASAGTNCVVHEKGAADHGCVTLVLFAVVRVSVPLLPFVRPEPPPPLSLI